MLRGVETLQHPLKYVFFLVQPKTNVLRGWEKVSPALTEEKLWFAVALNATFTGNNLWNVQTSPHLLPPLIAAENCLEMSMLCHGHRPLQTARHLRTFLSDQHRVNVKNKKNIKKKKTHPLLNNTFKDSWDVSAEHHTCRYSAMVCLSQHILCLHIWHYSLCTFIDWE